MYSRKVMHVFNQVQPLNSYLTNLVLGVVGNSTRFLLEREIEELSDEITKIESEYIHNALQDSSVTNRYDIILEMYLDSEEYFDVCAAAECCIKKGDLDQGNQIISEYLNVYPDSTLILQQLYSYQASSNINLLQSNEDQIATLEILATDNTSAESCKAKSILDFLNNTPTPDFELQIDYSPTLRNSILQEYNSHSRDMISLMPNPSNGIVNVSYDLPSEGCNAQLELYSPIGGVIKSFDISNYPMYFQLDCGRYTLSLVINGERIESQKLSIISK